MKKQIQGEFIVLEKKEWDPYVYSTGIILKLRYGADDDIYSCHLPYPLNDKDFYEGDIVDVTMVQNCDERHDVYHYNDFEIKQIKLINKLKWLEMK